jgi:ABC-type multidrug transport system ATPase subunit
MMAVEVAHLVKRYRAARHNAVDDISFGVPAGQLFCLLGPNGAGKSSLMRIAATVTRPTSGQLLFDGTDVVTRPDLLRRNLGYLPQDFGVYPHLTAREFLSYLAAVKGIPARTARTRIGELLELVDLAGAGRRPLGRYSGGMLRRVGIAQALLSDPKVLIVDEPTAGLDPEQRVLFRNLLADLAGDRVVLLSTHIVSDVESVASDIAIMAHGKIATRGTPQDLLHEAEGQVWEMTIPQDALAPLRERHLISRMIRTGTGVRVRLLAPAAPDASAVPVPPDLEDAYLAIVHRSPGTDLGAATEAIP